MNRVDKDTRPQLEQHCNLQAAKEVLVQAAVRLEQQTSFLPANKVKVWLLTGIGKANGSNSCHLTNLFDSLEMLDLLCSAPHPPRTASSQSCIWNRPLSIVSHPACYCSAVVVVQTSLLRMAKRTSRDYEATLEQQLKQFKPVRGKELSSWTCSVAIVVHLCSSSAHLQKQDVPLPKKHSGSLSRISRPTSPRYARCLCLLSAV